MSQFFFQTEIRIHQIPIKIRLLDWRMLGVYLLLHGKAEQTDDYATKCSKAALIQIAAKISKKYQQHWKKPQQIYQINLTPPERYALEDLLVNRGTRDLKLGLCFNDIRTQIHDYTQAQISPT